jgi:hypothetical protein
VGPLIIGCIASALIARTLFERRFIRTSAGDPALKRRKVEHAALNSAGDSRLRKTDPAPSLALGYSGWAGSPMDR